MTIKISQWPRENFCNYRKNTFWKRSRYDNHVFSLLETVILKHKSTESKSPNLLLIIFARFWSSPRSSRSSAGSFPKQRLEIEPSACCVFKGAFLWGNLDHGASKEPVNPWPEWTRRFLWCTMIQTGLGSLILIQITPKERTLSKLRKVLGGLKKLFDRISVVNYSFWA